MGRSLPMLLAINEAMHIAMAGDPDVILLGEDVAGGGGDLGRAFSRNSKG